MTKTLSRSGKTVARATKILAAMLVAVGSLALVPTAAIADDTQSFSGAPSANGMADTKRSRFQFSMGPGQSITDEYYVINNGTVAQHIVVYPTDAFNADNGDFALFAATDEPRDVGTWISFDGQTKLELDLEPGKSQVIPFQVTVPADARPGDHVGGIVASVLSPDGQVRLERRVATRLYVRVSGDLQPGFTIGALTTSYDATINPFNGTVKATFTLTNSGNVVLGAKATSSVTGLFGIPLSGEVVKDIPELFPGATRSYTVEIPGVWQWIWANVKVSLVAVPADGDRPVGAMPSTQRDAPVWGVPWVLLVVVLILLVVFLFRRSMKRANEKRAAAWLEYTEAEARRRARDEAEQAAGDASGDNG
jgi:hypothetical protein